MITPLVRVERSVPGVVLIRLNRPEKRNALNTAVLVQLAERLREIQEDESVRCAVLTGDTKAFSAGADISEMLEGGVDILRSSERAAAWQIIAEFPKPMIAAVNGVAFGGGNELAMLADLIVASEDSRFGQPEAAIGGMPGDGATQRLPRFVGRGAAMQILLTGTPINAAAALRLGLINEVTAPAATVERALTIAQEIAAIAPLAARAVKRAVMKTWELPLSEGLAFEKREMLALAESRDREEGLAAFIERRPPRFIGA
jgi:enoyl-CoA hydratase